MASKLLADSELNALLPLQEFGIELKSPQDSCLVPDKNLLIIADDANGILVYDLTGTAEKHLPDIKVASSICYDSFNKKAIVNVTQQFSVAPEPPGTLFSLDLTSWETAKITDLPLEPPISRIYTRWICTDPRNGNIFVACGDNNLAALFKFDISSSEWSVILKKEGDLEHPCIIPFMEKHVPKGKVRFAVEQELLRILVAAWDNDNDWRLLKISLDEHDEVVEERTVVAGGYGITEPWIGIIDEEEVIYAFDYKTGYVCKCSKPYAQRAKPFVFAGRGEYVAMEMHNNWLYVICSGQAIVKKYRLKKKNF